MLKVFINFLCITLNSRETPYRYHRKQSSLGIREKNLTCWVGSNCGSDGITMLKKPHDQPRCYIPRSSCYTNCTFIFFHLSLSLSLSLSFSLCVNLSSCHPPSTQIRPILLPIEGSRGSYTCIITFKKKIKMTHFHHYFVNFFTMQLYQYVTSLSLSLSLMVYVKNLVVQETSLSLSLMVFVKNLVVQNTFLDISNWDIKGYVMVYVNQDIFLWKILGNFRSMDK